MASPLPPTIFCTKTSLTSFTSFTPFFTKKIISKKPLLDTKPKHAFVCKATNNNDENQEAMGKLDRRNMLIGLGAGGLYGTLGLQANPSELQPMPAPDIATCRPSEIPYGCTTLDCCPPKPTRIINFKPDSGPIRTRVAAQNVANDPVYLAKYKRAVKLMKALPKDDPRSWDQQANVHCAYCDGAYPMPGRPNQEIQIHRCWLFFPWHRLYLYFHEKILGKLIGDPTFALPFWNWDAPAGMYMPCIYTDTSSPLYDKSRNLAHLPPKLVDLNYSCKDRDDNRDDLTIINSNLTTMHKQMIYNSTCPRLFFGWPPYSPVHERNDGAGNIEFCPHNKVHLWTGDPCQPNGEDMGTFYSAARDPIFYAHHSNVDRMWSIYKAVLKGTDMIDSDWLDSEFLFYDENKDLVRVKVRDSLDELILGYKYQDVGIPWLNSKPTARKSKNKRKADISAAMLSSKFPAMLSEIISVEVPRQLATKRTPAEKAKEDEVLVISGIEFDGNEMLDFDVYVNHDDAEVLSGKDKAEFAGSFVNVPHLGKKKIKTNLRLGITNLLADLEAEEDANVVVTLVPKCGISPKIGGLKIELISTT